MSAATAQRFKAWCLKPTSANLADQPSPLLLSTPPCPGLNTSIAAWQRDRVLVRREHSLRLYGALPLALARGLVAAPIIALRCVLFGLCYWMAGLRYRAGCYFVYLAACWCMNFASREWLPGVRGQHAQHQHQQCRAMPPTCCLPPLPPHLQMGSCHSQMMQAP